MKITSILYPLLFFSIFTSLTLCFSPTFTVTGTIELPEPTAERLRDITVSLENTNQVSYLNQDGKFTFNNVEPGYYFIHVNDNLYTYQTIFIEVTKKEVKAYDYNYKRGKGMKHKYPFEIHPINKIDYSDNTTTSLGSMLKNPYMIGLLLPLVLFFFTKMIPQEDLKEQSKQFNEQFKNMKDSFSFFK